jgi:hypothetical protein
LYNTGAWRFVEEVARVLRPGGLAYLSEFGSLTEAPQEARQLDHPEVSIHFGQLKQVALHFGLTSQCIPLAELLQIDLAQRQPARHSWMALRALAVHHQRHLPARAYGPSDLSEQRLFPFQIDGVRWVSLDSEGPGPLISRFWVLLLHKPDPDKDHPCLFSPTIHRTNKNA